MTGRELEELCSLGENTTVQFKLGFSKSKQLINRADGNQFIARIWRTTPKNEDATQRANEESYYATQKDEYTTQKGKRVILPIIKV